MRHFALLLAFIVALSTPAFAVQPDEILGDAALEARARTISAGLRCLVCQNQSIDDSDAPVARDLRILIRAQLQRHKSDAEIVAFVVTRYGEFVLLKPRFTPRTAILWLTPFVIVLAGLFVFFLRRRPAIPPAAGLSDTEKAELHDLLQK